MVEGVWKSYAICKTKGGVCWSLFFFAETFRSFLLRHFGHWNISVICFTVLLKLAISVFSLYFQTFSPKWLNFFRSLEKRYSLWPKKIGPPIITTLKSYNLVEKWMKQKKKLASVSRFGRWILREKKRSTLQRTREKLSSKYGLQEVFNTTFLCSHLDFSQENLRGFSEEHGEKVSPGYWANGKTRYKCCWESAVIGDCIRSLRIKLVTKESSFNSALLKSVTISRSNGDMKKINRFLNSAPKINTGALKVRNKSCYAGFRRLTMSIHWLWRTATSEHMHFKECMRSNVKQSDPIYHRFWNDNFLQREDERSITGNLIVQNVGETRFLVSANKTDASPPFQNCPKRGFLTVRNNWPLRVSSQLGLMRAQSRLQLHRRSVARQRCRVRSLL